MKIGLNYIFRESGLGPRSYIDYQKSVIVEKGEGFTGVFNAQYC